MKKMCKVKLFGKIIYALVIVFLAGVASAQPEETEFIVISKAPTMARIAILEFRISNPALAEKSLELAQLLKTDLERSGLFEIIPPEAYLQPKPFIEEEIDWQAWNMIDCQAVIVGELEETPEEKFQLILKLYDVLAQKLAVGKKYIGGEQSLRRMIHRFADETVLWLTGKRGGFESRIAFVSDRTGRKEIYVADSDGKNIRQLTKTSKLNLSPCWLDGSRLYYTGYDRGNPDLYLVDIFSGKKMLISSRKGLNITPAVGPRGKKLALAMESPGNNLDIYITNPDGSHPLRLTYYPSAELSPTWSPDGHYLAFVSDRTGTPQIYMMDLYRGSEASGNRPVRLTFEGDYNTSPAWSPDGRYLAYCRRIGNQFDLFLIDFQAGGTNAEVQLTQTHYNEEDPSWSPDGRMLIYSANPHGNYDIFMISIYSKKPIQITDWDSNETQPSWSENLFKKGGWK